MRLIPCAAAVGCVLSTLAASHVCRATDCNKIGPDVIVGDLMDVGNYASSGGIEALDLGTYSCNIGNAELSWISFTNQHPVIAQNLYKMKTVDGSTRFEQIGMSWLKHGFFALSNVLCCPTCVGTNGSTLGVGCSDPYCCGLNGDQSGLGPRWQVNAATGVFAYPFASPPYSGSVARRLQVKITDLEVSSASVLYFGEGHYVTPDDAAAGHKNNNASYRRVTVSGSGTNWNFGLTAATVREASAISAWKAADATVTETELNVPSDGKLIVSSKATDLGGGTWHYEFAVYNMNSDRSVGTFSVPIPAGANITNIGFHDVDYHSGDGPGNVNFSGTDWAAVVGANDVTWSTQTYAQNQSANAIRWATMYNFRFDANVPPLAGGGDVTLGLFKPGTPTSVVALAQIPGAAAVCSCNGDVNSDGHANGLDVPVFAQMYTNVVAPNNCADLAAPTSGALDAADLTAFIDAILNSTCP